jgi:hypothetical protein
MKKLVCFLTACLIVLTFSTVSYSAGVKDFAGTWNNVNATTRGVTKLDISVKGSSAAVHAWGKCHPKDCDWGTVRATYYKDGTLQTSYRSKIAVRSLIFRLKGHTMMTAQIKTHYVDKSGRKDQRTMETFKLAGTPGKTPSGASKPAGAAAAAGSTGKQTITVLNPNGGEELVAGNEYTVKWKTSGNISKVNITLLMENMVLKAAGKGRPPMPVLQIARQANNTGSYHFKIPYTLNSRFGQVFYLEVSTPEVRDWSDKHFTIYPLIDVAPTNIKVYSYEKKKKYQWIVRTVAAVTTGGQSEIIHAAAQTGKNKPKITKNTRIKIKFDLTNYGTEILRQKFMTKVSVLVRPGNDELNGAGFSHDKIIPILPGKLYHYEADIKPNDWNILPGKYRLELYTDPGHMLKEPEELRKNNRKIVDFEVGRR